MSLIDEYKAKLDYLAFVKNTGAEREAKGEAKGFADVCKSIWDSLEWDLEPKLKKQIHAVVEAAKQEGKL